MNKMADKPIGRVDRATERMRDQARLEVARANRTLGFAAAARSLPKPEKGLTLAEARVLAEELRDVTARIPRLESSVTITASLPPAPHPRLLEMARRLEQDETLRYVTLARLRDRNRSRPVVALRWRAAVLLRQAGYSRFEIGDFLQLSHKSVQHAWRKSKRRLA